MNNVFNCGFWRALLSLRWQQPAENISYFPYSKNPMEEGIGEEISRDQLGQTRGEANPAPSPLALDGPDCT